jgi:predicted Ser/Thr protein kinase
MSHLEQSRKSSTDLLVLKNDIDFRLRDDGNFQCNEHSCPDFGKKETVESFIRMMKHAEQEKANTKKEIFLYYTDNSKIKLNKHTPPSIVMGAINATLPLTDNKQDEESIGSKIESSARSAREADKIFREEISNKIVSR